MLAAIMMFWSTFGLFLEGLEGHHLLKVELESTIPLSMHFLQNLAQISCLKC